jgi:hypothetical protein
MNAILDIFRDSTRKTPSDSPVISSNILLGDAAAAGRSPGSVVSVDVIEKKESRSSQPTRAATFFYHIR